MAANRVNTFPFAQYGECMYTRVHGDGWPLRSAANHWPCGLFVVQPPTPASPQLVFSTTTCQSPRS